MNTRIHHRVCSFLLAYLETQEFLFLVALPVLLWWGLPLSVLTVLGNALFTPFLTLFLCCSVCIFTTQLLSLPNTWFIWLLEQLTRYWTWLLTCVDTQRWLITYRCPPLFWCFLIPLGAIGIMHYKRFSTRLRRVLALTGYLSLIAGMLQWYSTGHAPVMQILTRGTHHTLELYATHKTVILIDHGALCHGITNESWLRYTLLPTLIKLTGTRTIDHLVITKPRLRTFKALAQLCSMTSVKTIYMPPWHSLQSRTVNAAYSTLKKAAAQKGTTITCIHKDRITLPADAMPLVTLALTEKREQTPTLTYRVMQIIVHSSLAINFIHP